MSNDILIPEFREISEEEDCRRQKYHKIKGGSFPLRPAFLFDDTLHIHSGNLSSLALALTSPNKYTRWLAEQYINKPR